jgi:predicted DCC family thiol-disulfide oxidoreductase YuxK
MLSLIFAIQLSLLLFAHGFHYNKFSTYHSKPTSRWMQARIGQMYSSSTSAESQIDLLFDSECPICAMEVEFLKKRDINHRIRFTDLSSPDYDPSDHGNVQFAEGMRKIRAVLPDKTVVSGVEVFRKTYEAIGLGWIFAITKVPLIGEFADNLYDIWAENRLRITGRGDLADVLKDRSQKLKEMDKIDECGETCDIVFDDE